MSLRRELEGLDPARAGSAFDGAFDKCSSFHETGVMVDQLADDFPAFAGLIDRLRARIIEEVSDEHARTWVVLGGALALLALVEYAHVDDLRRQFPDAPV